MSYKDIKDFSERCKTHPDHQDGIVSNLMLVQRMHEEIDELRAYIEGSSCDPKERLIRIMGTFDLATGHADTLDELIDSLESELRDVLGHYRTAREWEEHLYEQGEVESRSKEDQRKADEAAWSDARIACAAIRDAALDAAGEDSRSIATIYFNYAASCVAVDDHWDAIRAKREGWGK